MDNKKDSTEEVDESKVSFSTIIKYTNLTYIFRKSILKLKKRNRRRRKAIRKSLTTKPRDSLTNTNPKYEER